MRALRYHNSTPPKPPTNWWMNTVRPIRPERPGIRYELLGDNIRGLREGFVGRRRLLQRTRPALQGW